MRLCLDIQPAIAQSAGIGRYTRALVEHLPALAGQDALRLFYFDFRQQRQTPMPAGATVKAIRWLPGRIAQYAWKTLDWPPFDWFAGAADLFHFPNFIRPPLSRGRSVTTIHDVSFLRFPEHTEPANLKFLRSRIQRTVELSDAIITDSAFSAEEIIETIGVPRSRVFSTPMGISHSLGPPPPEKIRSDLNQLGLDRPYILHVGTIEPRKNLEFLVKTFDQLKHFDGLLALAGMHGWKCEPILDAIRTARRKHDIRMLNFIPDPLLASLYAGAELLVFPSIYEGFGLPPLEAMACGTPVAASDIPVLREVLGSAAELIRGFDTEAWCHSLNMLLTDTDHRSMLRQRGFKQAARFTWQETARQTWDVYRKVAS